MIGLSMADGIVFDQMETQYQNQIYALQENVGAWQRAHAELDGVVKSLRSDLASVYAIRSALESFIHNKVASNHPLVFDNDLRRRIADAGIAALLKSNTWAATRVAGNTFPLPPMLDPHFDCTSASIADADRIVAKREIEDLNKRVTKLTNALAEGLATGAAILSQLTLVDPKNPWVNDESLHIKAAKLGLDRYVKAGSSDVRIATEAGHEFGLQPVK